MSRAAEKEASEVLHSLLSVERIEKQEHTETFQTNGTNGETAEAETQIQWHTPVSIAGHNIFSAIDGTTQFSQTIDNQQVIWEEHTIESDHHINSIYATTMQTTSADDDQLHESEPVKKKLKSSSKMLVKKLKVIKKKKKFLPLEGSMEPTKLEESAAQVKERFRRGCECQDESCFRGLNPDSVYKHRLNIAELTKGEHDMYLMGVTMACLANPDTTVRHKERRRLRAQYVYQGRRVCLDAFLYLENCTHYQLKRIRKHVMTHGVAPRVHGNHGKKPHNTFSLDIYRHATEFLKQYLEQHTNEANVSNSKQIIQLPWDITRKNLHDAYKEYGEVTDPGIKLMGYSTFRHFMKEQFPHVKFSKVELKNAAGQQQHQQQQTLQQTSQTDANQTTTIQIQQIPKQQLQTNVERPREQQLPKCIINQDVQQVIPLVVAPPHGDAGGGQHHQQATFLVTPVQQLLPNGNIVTATQTNNHATSNTFSYQLANTGYVINEHHTPYAFNRICHSRKFMTMDSKKISQDFIRAWHHLMEDRIAQMIKDGDLDQAKGEILNIEDCIRLETSAYNRKALLDRVKRLKEVYNENNIVDVSEISFKKPVQFEERRNSLNSTKDKIYVRDIDHGTIRLGSCIEAVIERCSNTVFEHFECQRSVFFVDIKNCQISCSGQQIRIDNYNNIEITVCTSTGVFLQNSAGIVIKRYGDSEDNKFANVYDFSKPLDSGNFKIL